MQLNAEEVYGEQNRKQEAVELQPQQQGFDGKVQSY